MQYSQTIPQSTISTHAGSGDHELLELVDMFVSELPDRMANMQGAARTQDWGKLETFAHQLKGSGTNYGFPEMTELAREVELAARSHNPAVVETTLTALVEFCRKARSR